MTYKMTGSLQENLDYFKNKNLSGETIFGRTPQKYTLYVSRLMPAKELWKELEMTTKDGTMQSQ